MGLGPLRYINYFFVLYYTNVGHNTHKCTHNNISPLRRELLRESTNMKLIYIYIRTLFLAQNPKLMGLSLLRYINYSTSLYLFNVWHNSHNKSPPHLGVYSTLTQLLIVCESFTNLRVSCVLQEPPNSFYRSQTKHVKSRHSYQQRKLNMAPIPIVRERIT